MAGKKTTLMTGSNAKIKVNGVTLAYATDIQYGVRTDTIPVETMGRYEVVSNEPIAMTVSGSFAVVRYTSGAIAGDLMKAKAGGNGVANWKAAGGKGLDGHFDPAKILTSETIDIEIYRKGDGAGSDGEKVITIQDARLVSKGGSLNKRGIYMEQFAFVATNISDDSYTAGFSGDEDLS
jgi:hypothetical protein